MDKQMQAIVSHQALGLSKDDYDLLRSLLERQYGVDLEQMGLDQILAKVTNYCTEHALASVSAAIADLRANQSKIDELGRHIYSRRTWFNRFPEHFKFLVQSAL